MLRGNPTTGFILGGVVSFILFLILAKNTYIDNNRHLAKSILAFITKVPLAIIWIANLIQLLNPSGTGNKRRQNRGQALVILTLITPIISLLVVNKSGSYFNPKSWITGRKGGSSIRDNM